MIFTEDWFSVHIPLWNQYVVPWAAEYREQLSSLSRGLRGLEIGSFEGRSAIWIMHNVLNSPDDNLDCVDLFDGTYARRFQENVQQARDAKKIVGRVKQHAGLSHALLAQFFRDRRSFDLIYIDGGHEGSTVLVDLIFSWQMLLPKGLLILDDYRWRPELPPSQKPALAIDTLLTLFERELRVMQKGDQVMVVKR